jgi:hypothetical protein
MAHVQSTSTTGSGTSLTLNFTSPPTAGNLLVYTTGGDANPTAVGDNKNGPALSAVGIDDGANFIYADIHYIKAHAGSGTTTLTRQTAASANHALCVAEYNSTVNPELRTSDTDSRSAASSITGPVSVEDTDLVVVGTICDTAFQAYGADANFTERVDTSGVRPLHVQDRIMSAASAALTSTVTTDGGVSTSLRAVLAAFDVNVRVPLERFPSAKMAPFRRNEPRPWLHL